MTHNKKEENPFVDHPEVKRQIFSHVVDQTDPLLNRNYEFIMSGIRHLMEEGISKKPLGSLYNRDIKRMLISHYGDQIQFEKNDKEYKSGLFSSSIHSSELASKIFKNQIRFMKQNSYAR